MYRNPEELAPETPYGDLIHIYRDFPIPPLHRSGTIRVFLPPMYGHGGMRHPVMYMQDGQYLGSAGREKSRSWRVEECLTDRDSPRMIIVGIDSHPMHRTSDYHPWSSQDEHVNGPAYARFVAKILKPFIDQRYLTRGDAASTGIGGCSFGALISLYTGLQYPETFSRIAAFSTAAGRSREQLYTFLDTVSIPSGLKVYVDSGAREFDSQRVNQAFIATAVGIAGTLMRSGLSAERIRIIIDPDGTHHEVSWGRRFCPAIQWLFREYSAKHLTF